MSLIRCNPSHVQTLSELLASAFFDDPLYAYLFPEIASRRPLAAWDLGRLLHYGLRFGEVYAPAGLEGCAVWLPPGETDFTEARMAEVGMLDSAAVIGAQAERRMLAFVAESEKYHRLVAPQPHWYLVLLGVAPAWQRSGIGSALLGPLLARAGAGGYPVYLETANPENLRFYHKHGFDVRAQAQLTDGADLWYLVRAPAGTQAVEMNAPGIR